MAVPRESQYSTKWSTGGGKSFTLGWLVRAAVTVSAGVGIVERDSRSVSLGKGYRVD